MIAAKPVSSNVHASCVALGEDGLLIEGPSGSGKSWLAAQLIAHWHRGSARLVSDDRTLLIRTGTALVARPHPAIAGKLEWRGLGIVSLPLLDAVRLRGVVRLGRTQVRMPGLRERTTMVSGVPLPSINCMDAAGALSTLLAMPSFWQIELCTSLSPAHNPATENALEKMVHRTIKDLSKATASSPVPRQEHS